MRKWPAPQKFFSEGRFSVDGAMQIWHNNIHGSMGLIPGGRRLKALRFLSFFDFRRWTFQSHSTAMVAR
jgi:hypothetical protein